MALRVQDGAPLSWGGQNLGTMILERARAEPDAPHFLVRDGDAFRTLTRADVALRAREVAAGLASLGLARGDKVAILADTRVEWALADFGILLAGGVTVTVYPTLSAEQVRELLVDAGVSLVFVDSAAQQAKLASVLPDAVRHWVAMDPIAAGLDDGKRAVAWDALAQAGRAALAREADFVERRLADVRPDDLSTIIYTSGTTGVPKGAALTHANWLSAIASATQVFDLRRYPDPRTVAFLPLAHVLSRLVVLTFTSLPGGVVAFGSPRTFARDLADVKPRAIVCVPRVWERMHAQIHKAIADAPPLRRRIFAAAERVATEVGRLRGEGRSVPTHLRAQHALFERLVYRKLRARIGFDDLQGALSTAAAIRPDLLHFYQGVGVNVVELWGMTELAGPGVTNTLERFRPGTVGWPMPGIAVALDEDGEILVAGPNVFPGYHARPEENAASFVERDGRRWFRTGDLGAFDTDGALRIVDRKKEIEVLDTGKKISPVAIEERLKSASPFVAEACLVATGRKFAAALVQPDYDRLVRWARERAIPFDASRVVIRPDPTGQQMTYAVGEDLLVRPEVRALYQEAIDATNARVADFETIRAFHLVPHAFTIDRDELTLTLKKKRRVILAHHRDEIERLFGG